MQIMCKSASLIINSPLCVRIVNIMNEFVYLWKQKITG